MAPGELSELGQAARRLVPMERIQSQPWAFMALALAAGAGVGVLVRRLGLRRAFGLYLLVRRFV